MPKNNFKKDNFKCHFCDECDGYGCIGQMPGMGGPNSSENFILNCSSWKLIEYGPYEYKNQNIKIRLAPVTGALENVGYADEKTFYFDIIKFCTEKKVALSIGDGTPDEKLLNGIEALKFYKQKAAVFIKPYPDKKFFERSEWAVPVAEYAGIDIDSYNIVTMRNLVNLEKKSVEQLKKIKEYFSHHGIPFAIKGIFTKDDVKMVQELKPDVAYISNHGGRVETRRGSTAEFLKENYRELKNASGKLWVDGGLRTQNDFEKALSFGADEILLGRPFITSLCKEKTDFKA